MPCPCHPQLSSAALVGAHEPARTHRFSGQVPLRRLIFSAQRLGCLGLKVQNTWIVTCAQHKDEIGEGGYTLPILFFRAALQLGQLRLTLRFLKTLFR